jgi:preprotein translocase subunit SecF
MTKQRKALKHFDTGRIDFMGKGPLMGILSLIMVVGSLVVISVKGFNYGIDFAGGTEVQVKFDQPVQTAELRKELDVLGYGGASVQKFGEDNEFLLRFEVVQAQTEKEANAASELRIRTVVDGLKKRYADKGLDIRRVDSVGPQIGEELKRNGLLAAFYSFIIILIYVGLRFDFKYSPGAVLCLVHDTIITLGIFALLGKQVNVQIMAAVLTIIGYSLNDTIINFDRIRENEGLFRDEDLKGLINRSVNDVLSRTILTSGTTLLSVGALYFLAGGVIADFAFTLGIGIIVGTYSSIYVAAPLVLLFQRMQDKRTLVTTAAKLG